MPISINSWIASGMPETGKQSLRIEVDARAMEEAVAILQRFPEKGPRYVSQAINRTIDRVYTQAVRAITANIPVKATRVRKSMVKRKARPASLAGEIVIKGRRLPLYDFKSREVAGGVRYNMGAYGVRTVEGAFIATMPSGHTGVWVRYGRMVAGFRRSRHKHYQKIRELFGPSIPHVAEKDATLDRALKIDASTILRERLANSLSRLLVGDERGAQTGAEAGPGGEA